MEVVCRYFLYFIIYSFIGWLIEVVCKSIEYKRFVNRGLDQYVLYMAMEYYL